MRAQSANTGTRAPLWILWRTQTMCRQPADKQCVTKAQSVICDGRKDKIVGKCHQSCPGSLQTLLLGNVIAVEKFWGRYLYFLIILRHYNRLPSDQHWLRIFCFDLGWVRKMLRNDRPLHQQGVCSKNCSSCARVQATSTGEGEDASICYLVHAVFGLVTSCL